MDPSNRRGATPATLTSLLVLLALASGAGSFWLLRNTPSVPERHVTNRPNQIEEDGYTSSQACRSCHPREYATWSGSYHRTMTQVATPQTVVPSFENVRIDNVYGGSVRLERQGNDFLATFADPDWNEPTGQRPDIKRKVVMITGSHYQQVFWYETGQDRLVGQLP